MNYPIMNDTEYEPMDIDSSANSYSAMEISYNEIIFEDHPHIEKETPSSENVTDRPVYINTVNHTMKKFHIETCQLRKNKNYCPNNRMLLITFLGSVIISFISYNIVHFKCCDGFNVELLRYSLSSEVFGQSEAIETLIHALKINASSKILFLYGGTGVGKTLSVSIALDNILNYTNVYHYTMPSFAHKFSNNLKLGFIFCQKSIIVVDDLNAEDKHIEPFIKEIIDKNESLRKNLTIILVYNCDNISNKFVKVCDKSFLKELQQTFNDVKAIKYFIRYVPLTEESLKRCIENELKLRLISNVDVNIVMKNFNVSHDGCKGVYPKIKSLNTL